MFAIPQGTADPLHCFFHIFHKKRGVQVPQGGGKKNLC